MFDKIKNIFGKKEKISETNARLSKKLHNMHFKYISEKKSNGEDIIIARNGHINIEGENGDVLCATEGVKTVFRLKISEMNIWEFMSLNGCVINFTDIDSGEKRNISVYYDAHLVRP